MTVDQVVDAAMRSAVFFRASGGGVTFSGGEPTGQPDFLNALIQAFDALGVDMAIETSGDFYWDAMSRSLSLLSMIFVDIKHMDSGMHRRMTGRPNLGILQNIKAIGGLGVRTVVRVPLIPGFNDGEENLAATAEFVKAYCAGGMIEVLPYHKMASGKYVELGLEIPDFSEPRESELQRAKRIMEASGATIVDFR